MDVGAVGQAGHAHEANDLALAQKDVKKLVAYSSVSHLGFVMLGLFALNTQGVEGAIYQMLGHGLSTGALFLLVGIIYERRHTRMIDSFGGLAKVMPVYTVFFMITMLSSVGLPGMNGFVGEFTILLGTFDINWVAAAFGTFGIVLAAWYLLTAVRKLLYGPFNPANQNLKDMNVREVIIALPLVFFFFVIGLFPNLLFDKINPATAPLIEIVQTTGLIAGR